MTSRAAQGERREGLIKALGTLGLERKGLGVAH